MVAPDGTAVELRRAPHLTLYWEERQFVVHNYATGRRAVAHELVVGVLEAFGDWRSADAYVSSVPESARRFASDVVAELQRQGFLQRRGEETALDAALAAWGAWNPAAGLFHTATRNPKVIDLDTTVAALEDQAGRVPMPPVSKAVDGPRVTLPPPGSHGAFARVLKQRRTWRKFGREPMPLATLASLLHLTAGVQGWVTAAGEGRVPLKTSPSGGARHPIETYLAVRQVSGLAPGFYHYASGAHELVRLPGPRRRPDFERLLPTQWWYGAASILVFFTAVFERTRWRYPGPRAYRAVLVEAGHVCQTFCLTATALGLAPFCSLALADAEIEQSLGLDGIAEAVVYAAGAGTRPRLGPRELPGMLPPRRAARGRRPA